MDNATTALAKMNMILHDCPTADIWQDNSLSSPHFKDAKTAPQDLRLRRRQSARSPPKRGATASIPAEDEFDRFEFGMPPDEERRLRLSAAHPRARLKSTGKGAVILPHGVLFRGGAEADIRKQTRRSAATSRASSACRPNLFYGTGIPACIIVLDKENAHARKGIFMIDASKGFIKDGNKNRLRARTSTRSWMPSPARSKSPRYSRMVPLAEISDPKNDYNLNLPRYIDSTEPEDMQDIDGHLRGGIPNRDIDALDSYWQVFPAVRATLVREGGSPRLQPAQDRGRRHQGRHLRPPRSSLPSINRSTKLFEKWTDGHQPRLNGIAMAAIPRR